MAHRRISVGRVFVVAWRTPEADDLRVIVDEVRAHHVSLGRRLLYLSVIGPSGLPTGNVRDALVDFYRDVLGYCDSMFAVIEGNEFEMSIKRSVIANVMLVVQGRGRVFIENTLDRVRLIAPVDVRGELNEAIRVASERRVFDFAR
jgi:hypothetical protein